MIAINNNKKLSVGLPLMHAELGEKRCFLPKLVGCLEKYGAQVVLEHHYGETMGLTAEDFLQAAPLLNFVDNEVVFQQDIVLVLRCPDEQGIRSMRPGTCLVSMLHYATRPKRVNLLRDLGLQAISLDSISDDSGRRMVENFNAVAWNGMEAAFTLLQQIFPQPGFFSPARPPIQVTLIGAGNLGAHTVRAAVRYGNLALQEELSRNGVPGVVVSAVDTDITNQTDIMRDLLAKTDILVDASSRADTTRAIIPNQWLSHLPHHAIILDLCVDPYQQIGGEFHTKGIEGIPQGNLDQYVFTPDDPAFDAIPAHIPSSEKRYTVSCYSWPGIHPHDCMQVYGSQLHPVMRTLVSHGGLQGINQNGNFFERAISRALLSNHE
jgi:alanine dehydrogenase